MILDIRHAKFSYYFVKDRHRDISDLDIMIRLIELFTLIFGLPSVKY